MLRRHFMTKVGYRPNVIITYYSSKKLSFYYNKTNNLKDNFDIDIYLINEEFNDGIGKIYLYIKKIDENIQFNNIIYDKTGQPIDNIFNPETIISYFIITGIDELGFVPNYVEKLITEDVKFLYEDMIKDTLLKRFIIPPNINDDGYINHISLPNTIEDVIFTAYTAPKFPDWRNKNIIKCPPNLVDKYREYYPNVVAASNILYIKKVTQDSDKNIKFSNSKDITNELYVSKNYTDDGFTEINIINYNDFEANRSNVGVYSDYGGDDINRDYITEIILPDSITQLTNRFIGSNITKLTIPKNVTNISNYWNKFCILEENFVNLSSTPLPYELRDCIIKNGKEENNCVINEYNQLVFVRDAINRRIIIPDYVTEFYNNPFYNVDIDYVFISKNITNKTLFAYTSCIIEVSEENKKYDSRNNCNAMIETATNTLVAGNSISTIPDSIEIIEENAFYRAGFDDNYILDLKNVKQLKKYCFNESGYKNKLFIPKTIEYIGHSAFDECYIKQVIVDKENKIYNDYNNSNVIVETATDTLIFMAMGKYNIPEGIKIIKTSAISQDNGNVEQIYIPKSVIKINEKAIGFRTTSKNILYDGTIEEWNNIEKANNWYNPFLHIDSYTIHCSNGDIIVNKS